MSNDEVSMLANNDGAADEKTREAQIESCSARRREEEETLDRLVDFDFDFDLCFDSFNELLLSALLFLGWGTHHRVCLEVIVGPRSD